MLPTLSLHPRAHMISHVIPWASARQTPLSMDFSRQEYWSGLPFPSPTIILLKASLKKKKSFPGLSHSQYKLALFCWNYSLTWTYTVNTIPSTPFYPPPTKENRPRIYQCRRSLVFLWLTYWRFLLCWESGRLSGGPYIDSSAPLGCRTAWCVCHHSPGEEAPIKSLATAPQPEPPRVSVKGVASWLLSGFLFFPPNIY